MLLPIAKLALMPRRSQRLKFQTVLVVLLVFKSAAARGVVDGI